MRHGIGAVLQGWREGDFWIVAWFERVAGELVVYSSKWTTGSALFLVFALFLAVSLGASGPLFKVGHWLDDFPGFWPGFGDSPGASGLLSKVGHWLDAFPDFWPGFADFLGASGPLFKVGHWLGAFPGFWPVFNDFLGASGPLDGVDH